MNINELINEPEVASLRFTTLRDLLTPFGFTVTRFQFDPGERVTVTGPGVNLSASAEDGDPFTASGLVVAKMNAWRLVPESVMESIING